MILATEDGPMGIAAEGEPSDTLMATEDGLLADQGENLLSLDVRREASPLLTFSMHREIQRRFIHEANKGQ